MSLHNPATERAQSLKVVGAYLLALAVSLLLWAAIFGVILAPFHFAGLLP